jgi:hypothetical protein
MASAIRPQVDTQPGNDGIGNSAKSINLRRGFNRLYAVASVFYAFWIIWYPLHSNNRGLEVAEELTGRIYRDCLDRGEPYSECVKQHDSSWELDYSTYKPGKPWVDFGWHLLWILPCVMLVPPVILYWSVRAFIRIGRWVVNGFTG